MPRGNQKGSSKKPKEEIKEEKKEEKKEVQDSGAAQTKKGGKGKGKNK